VRLLLLLSTFLIIFGILVQNAIAQQSLSVNSLRIGTHPDKTRIVVELSKRADFRAFMLQNPSRLVLDLPAFDWRAGQPSRPPGSLVGATRHGALQPGLSRIVIDLEAASTLKSAFFLPSGPGVSDRVVIDFSRAPKGWSPAQERMFGSLNSQAPKFDLEPQIIPAPDTGGFLKAPPQKPIAQTRSEEKTVTPDMPPVVQARKGPKPVIVIDAGHGGEDPGAIGANGTKEKTVTLAAAKELKDKLEGTGRYRVYLTRSSDKFIKLQDRVKMGRNHGADLFISLHADSIDKPGVSGASIYTLSNTASDAQTAKLAARENRADLIAGVDLSHEDKEVANILIDLAMRDTMNQSKFFANTVVKQAQRQGIELLEKPHRFAGFAVLKAPDVPSVLIEMGFMSNKREVSQLSSPAYRAKIVNAISGGIDTYFAKIHKNGQN
jgi:N-acetylmuramoyl-L-alanine amidase